MRRLVLLAAVAALFIPLTAAAASPGDLVKLADDGNPKTQVDSAVYYVGADGKRYVFPNSQTYFTWYKDFSQVKVVSASEMSSLPIGGNVTYRPGTRLVKITSDPKVYAVEPGGVLRGIGSEAVATALYGPDWNKRVDDVPDTYFTNYTVGSQLAAAVYPSGSVVERTSDHAIFYIDGGTKRHITSQAALDALRVQSKFILSTTSDLSSYPDGADLSGADTAIDDTSGKNQVAVSATPTFTSVTPASSYIAVGKDDTLLQLNYSAAEATRITKMTVRVDALTNKDTTPPDTDQGGLIYGNNAQPNLSNIRFVASGGDTPFGKKELTLDVSSDQSQTLVFQGDYSVAAGATVSLQLKAQLNQLLPNGEQYRVTLVPSGTVVTSNGRPVGFEPTAELSGPTLTSLADDLQVLYDAGVGPSTVVRGTKLAEAGAFKLQATTAVPNVVTSLTFQGYIDEHEGGNTSFLPGSDSDNGSPTQVRAVMPKIGIYDTDGNLLGGPVDVTADGRAVFSGLHISIPAGGSQRILLKGDVSPTVDLELSGDDRIAFDMENAAQDAVVTDASGAPITAAGIEPNGGVTPKHYLTVRHNGTVDLKYAGAGGKIMAGEEASLGVVTVTTQYDSYDLKNLTFTATSGQDTVGNVRLEYPSGTAKASATASFLGNTATFSGLDIVVPADTSTTLTLYGTAEPKDAGAVYGEPVNVSLGTGGPFTFVSNADGSSYGAADFTGGDLKISQNTASSRIVRWSDISAALDPSSPTTAYRDSEAEVLRFTMTALPSGPIRIKKMTFKVTPSDAGTISGPNNDALEIWANVNGDFADDDGIVALRRVVDGTVQSTQIGEGASGHIKYSVVSGGTEITAPSSHVSAGGDYGKIAYEFPDGSEYTIAAGTTETFELDLMTSALDDSASRNLGVELMTGADFQFTDIPSGSYTPLTGGLSGGVTVTSSVTVPR